MSILSRLRRKKAPASIAKERLQIIIAHERQQAGGTDYLAKLQREILAVIAKYIEIDQDQVNVQLQRSGGSAILELNIAMPERVLDRTPLDEEMDA